MTTPTSGVLIGGMGVEIGAGLSRTRTGLYFIEIRFQEFDLGHSGSAPLAKIGVSFLFCGKPDFQWHRKSVIPHIKH
jgi:hypothetical protein